MLWPSLSPTNLQHFELKRPCWGSWDEPRLPPPFCVPQVRDAQPGDLGQGFQLSSLAVEQALPRNHRSHWLPHRHPGSRVRRVPNSAGKAFSCPEAGQGGISYQFSHE